MTDQETFKMIYSEVSSKRSNELLEPSTACRSTVQKENQQEVSMRALKTSKYC